MKSTIGSKVGVASEVRGRDGNFGELVVAIVAPVGTDTGKVWRSVRSILGDYDYQSCLLRVSKFLEDQKVAAFTSQEIHKVAEYDRLTTSMNAGDELRKRTGLKEVMDPEPWSQRVRGSRLISDNGSVCLPVSSGEKRPTFWDHADRAQERVKEWPEWKRDAANAALVSKPADRRDETPQDPR